MKYLFHYLPFFMCLPDKRVKLYLSTTKEKLFKRNENTYSKTCNNKIKSSFETLIQSKI